MQFYISREWLNKFNTFTEPGPITNHTFLCQHGGINLHNRHYALMHITLVSNILSELQNEKNVIFNFICLKKVLIIQTF